MDEVITYISVQQAGELQDGNYLTAAAAGEGIRKEAHSQSPGGSHDIEKAREIIRDDVLDVGPSESSAPEKVSDRSQSKRALKESWQINKGVPSSSKSDRSEASELVKGKRKKTHVNYVEDDSDSCKESDQQSTKKIKLAQSTGHDSTASVSMTCSCCGNNFSKVEDFTNHLRLRECPVVCPFVDCSYRPAEQKNYQNAYWKQSLDVLTNHIKAKHTRQAELACPMCDKRLVSPDAYRYHVSQHKNGAKFYCLGCQKFFPSELEQKHNLKYHSIQGNYPCSACGKLFATEGNLKVHSKVHSGNYAYKCEHCPKQFHQKNNLLVHCQRRHGDSRQAASGQRRKLKIRQGRVQD